MSRPFPALRSRTHAVYGLAVLCLFAGVHPLDPAQAAPPRVARPGARSPGRPARLLGLLLQPGEVEGGKPTRLVVVLNRPAPPGGVTVTLASSHSRTLRTPRRLLVPGGVQRMGFLLKTTPVDHSTDVVITGTEAARQSGFRPLRRSVLVRLQPARDRSQ